jgi:ABC-type branched-subunit amino acid transport system substrate-binding protein
MHIGKWRYRGNAEAQKDANVLTISCGAAVIVACALAMSFSIDAEDPVHSANLPPIVIGVSNVQSGLSSTLGHKLVLGSQSYFDLVNGGGGIHGRKISILVKDDKYEPDPAVKNTNDLIENDKVFFLFDYIGTPTLTGTLPLLRYYQSYNIVNVAPLSGAEGPLQRQPRIFHPRFLLRGARLAHRSIRALYSPSQRTSSFGGSGRL